MIYVKTALNIYAANITAITTQNVIHAFSGRSTYIHQRETKGNARSIIAIIRAQAMSRKNSFLCGVKYDIKI